jgi:hypothetical protein
MIEALWKHVPLLKSDGNAPRLEFAERLAHIARDDNLAQQLREWVDNAALNLARSGQEVDVPRMRARLQNQSTNEVGATAYLMIVLLPTNQPLSSHNSQPLAEEYRLTVIFWQGEGDEHIEDLWYPLRKGQANGPDDKDDLSIIKFGELDMVLEMLFLRQQEILEKASEHLIVEIFIPASLVNCDLDQWPDPHRRRRSSKITYGARYPCVVRSAERLEDRLLRADWRVRWGNYSDEHPLASHAKWLDTIPVDLDELEVELRRSQEFLFLGLPVLPSGGEWESDLYYLCLDTGIPIAIWPRHVQKQVNLNDVKGLIGSPTFSLMRKRIVDIRLEAAMSESHLGKGLALFWDDPNRIPNLGTHISALPTNVGS